MESTLLSPNSSTMSILSLTRSLNSHSTLLKAQILHRRLSNAPHLIQLAARAEPRRLLGPVGPRHSRLQFRTLCFVSGGGGGGTGGSGGESGGGGGGGAAGGGDEKAAVVVDDGSGALGSDVIILDVGGMTCGGCAASVKRILESQPQVSSASVNLTTETAIVWPVSEAKASPNWRKDVGEALAKHLTTCGFKSNLRDQGTIDGIIQS